MCFPEQTDDVRLQIELAMRCDQPELRRLLRSIERAKRAGRPFDRNERRFQELLSVSLGRRSRRDAVRPRPSLKAALPVNEHRGAIESAIRDHQVVVVCGETGSGKTTQLPQICLAMGRGEAGLIGHTQPRRIAARAVATRIAEELGSAPGRLVGHKIRFQDTVGPEAFIKVMTDGILLAELHQDRQLRQYDTIILDEAHERSLNIDFLLGALRNILPRRPELKLIITSATIDPEHFSEHFGGETRAPIVRVPGRTFPVEVRWKERLGDTGRDLMTAIAEAVEELSGEGAGDVLVFLPGERDIHDAHRMLRGRCPPGTEILPLYSRLSVEQQQRVFAPHSGRRVVLATNVAETSLTVPGIRFVVDPGLARVSRYSARSRVQRLPIEEISQSSADQRAGRCGRVRDGICIRLYSSEDYASRERFTQPEIQRTDLAEVILRMKLMDLGEFETFPFLDPPKGGMIRDGVETLWEIGAIDAWGELTAIGRRLGRLPVPPRIGRMLLEADRRKSLREVLIIAAALSIQDPRERPAERTAQVDARQAEFAGEQSDFLTLLNIWEAFHERRRTSSWSDVRRWCLEHDLHFLRMREWQDVHHQLMEQCRELQLRVNRERAGYEAIHRALLAGILSGVGLRDERVRGQYRGASGLFFIWPASCLFRAAPAWIVSSEIVETTKRYARLVAKIQPGWIEDAAGHLLRRSHSEPRWDAKSGRVMALEKGSIFGLPIYERRRVPYDGIDAVFSRGAFIEHALVLGNCRSEAPFMKHNRALIEQVRAMESKYRRRDLLRDVESRCGFFEPIVPHDVVSLASFDKWRKQAEREDPHLLYMGRGDVLRVEPEAEAAHMFPDNLDCSGVRVGLEYTHDPGGEEDGVTAVVPLVALPLIDCERLEWLVPGFLEPKVTELIRLLPKQLRTSFVPAPEYAKAAIDRMEFGVGSLARELSRVLLTMTGVEVAPSCWRMEELPEHLRMRIRVVDEGGGVVRAGREVLRMREDLRVESEAALNASVGGLVGRRGIRSWDFGEFPNIAASVEGGNGVLGHVALIDDGDSVSIVARHDAARARRLTRGGLRRMFWIASRDELRFQLRQLPGIDSARVNYVVLTRRGDFDEQVGLVIAERAFLGDTGEVRTAAAFEERLTKGFSVIWQSGLEVIRVVGQILGGGIEVQRMLEGLSADSVEAAARDMREQLAAMLEIGFLANTEWSRLAHLPRYLQAMQRRLEKIGRGGLARDAALMEEVGRFWSEYLSERRARGAEGEDDAGLEEFRWLIEEFRVSLFAQELGTATTVSSKRLETLWERLVSQRGG